VSKVIVTCAITGSVHTPSMSQYLPKTPAEIAVSAIDAAKAGAAVVHLHARDPETGKPTQDPQVYARFLPEIAAESNVVINITTGGSPVLPLEERLAPAVQFQPEIASLNMGSMNFGLYDMLKRFRDFKYEWERPYLQNSDDRVFRNTFRDIARILDSCGSAGTRFEIECYDIGHIYTAAHFLDRGLLTTPIFIQSVFGIRGGIGVHFEDVAMMKRTADRLFGQDYVWSVLGSGRFQMPIATMAASMGGNVRVGLEDSLWDSPGKLARSNADQVRRICSILEALSLSIATPDEARQILHLKGKASVRI
jgi:uncharacterized protein (DUF849 family)